MPSVGRLTEFRIDFGIPKRTLALMTDEKRMETKKQIVERTKELIAERIGQGSVRFSLGNTANVADADPNGATKDRPDIKKEQKDVSVSGAGSYLFKHQQSAGCFSFIEEFGDFVPPDLQKAR